MRRGLAAAAVLAGILVSGAAHAEPEHRSWVFDRGALAVSVGAGRLLGGTDLSQSLLAHRFGELGGFSTRVGLCLLGVWDTGFVLQSEYDYSIAANPAATLTTHQLVLDAGYVAASRGEVLVYPVAGLGFGTTTLELASPLLGVQSYEEVLTRPEYDTTLASPAFVVHAGFMASLWGSGRGDFVGLTTGFTYSILKSDWKHRGVAVTGSPNAPSSQVYLALLFGWHPPRR